MGYKGVIVHQSFCSSINGKGYDFFITRDGEIIPAPLLMTDPLYINICLEGDFATNRAYLSPALIEQFFIFKKLVSELSSIYHFDSECIFPHDTGCPGSYFPWSELVISVKDGYH